MYVKIGQFPRSSLRICLLRTNVPKGINEETKAINTFMNDHPDLRHTSARVIMNATKRIPWIPPAILTARGIPARYFNGMATPSKRR